MTYVDTDPSVTAVTTERSAPESFTHEQLAEITKVYRNEYPSLLKQVRKFDVPDPEGVVQETFVKALRAWNSYEYLGLPRRAWLSRILSNAALDSLRKPYARNEKLTPEAYKADSIRDNDIDDEYSRIDDNIELQKALDRIKQTLVDSEKPSRWYSIFIMNVIDGYSYDEIAEKVGIPKATVGTSIHRMKKLLQDDPELLAVLGRN